MYGFPGTHQVSTVTVATDGTISEAVKVQGANKVGIYVPTFSAYAEATSASVYVQVSNAQSSGFARLQAQGPYSSVSTIGDWCVPTTEGDRTIVCEPVVGFNYMKVELGSTATAALRCKVHHIT